VLAFAQGVGDAVLENLGLSGQILDLTVEHREGVDVVGQGLDSCEGLDGCLNFSHLELLS